MAGMPPWSVPAGTVSGLKGLDLSPWFQNEQLNFQRQQAARQTAQAQQAAQMDMQAQKSMQDYREKIDMLELKAAGEQATEARKERADALALREREGEAERGLKVQELGLRERELDEVKIGTLDLRERTQQDKVKRDNSIAAGRAQARSILGAFPGEDGLARAYEEAVNLFPDDNDAREAYLATLGEVERAKGKVSELESRKKERDQKVAEKESIARGRAAAQAALPDTADPEQEQNAYNKGLEIADPAEQATYFQELEKIKAVRVRTTGIKADMANKEQAMRLKKVDTGSRIVMKEINDISERVKEKKASRAEFAAMLEILKEEQAQTQSLLATDPKAASRLTAIMNETARTIARLDEIDSDIADADTMLAARNADLDGIRSWVLSGEGDDPSIKWNK